MYDIQQEHVALLRAAEAADYPVDRLMRMSRETVFSWRDILYYRSTLLRLSLDQFEDILCQRQLALETARALLRADPSELQCSIEAFEMLRRATG